MHPGLLHSSTKRAVRGRMQAGVSYCCALTQCPLLELLQLRHSSPSTVRSWAWAHSRPQCAACSSMQIGAAPTPAAAPHPVPQVLLLLLCAAALVSKAFAQLVPCKARLGRTAHPSAQLSCLKQQQQLLQQDNYSRSRKGRKHSCLPFQILNQASAQHAWSSLLPCR